MSELMDRHIQVGISQSTDDPTQHHTYTVRARYHPAPGGWVARAGAQTHNDQFAGWDPESAADRARAVFPSAAACLGAAVTCLIEAVDRAERRLALRPPVPPGLAHRIVAALREASAA
jgi:hypothetical protein